MKIKSTLFALSIIFIGCHSKEDKASQQAKSEPTIIAFGSCSHQDKEDQMWEEITEEKPDLMILGGDNIYGDTKNMTEMAQKYSRQKERDAYQKMRSTTKIIGIWDDHDYGVNDGGKHFSKKDSSKLLMLDFLDVPAEDPIRERDGAYSAYSLGEVGNKVKIILLDTRYFRDTLQVDTTGERRYLPNETGDILGEPQWTWLKNELMKSTAQVNIIVSSIQVIASEHPFEKWANFPVARKRLLETIGTTSPENTIIISGDRHIAELSAMEIDGLNYPLYDLTASGLTHTWSKVGKESNAYRVGELIIAKNYGLIKIDWQNEELILDVKGANQETYLSHTIPLN